MTEYEEHLQKYRRNKEFLRLGLNQNRIGCPHWEIVAQYYACIHLIEAVLHRQFNEEILRYAERTERMYEHPKVFGGCIPYYKSLAVLAHTARYKSMGLTDEADKKQARLYLKRIEQALKAYIV
ncbi:hypothetical protein [Acetanaerobacterium elongatum]|uniref:HEPN domain-containing protein n=1 Tax=Acetanaerobacterium elongatum TaxID=258515 RepID=A0A1H0GKN6_9FIRM|nr:hypothetical protein [Acetanaerobacterium elongatum]SDO07424.1 hypothetical protein SAMN05192585_1523 [Acetanaerobacterium elongatum]